MYRIIKQQKNENRIIGEIDNLLFAEMLEVKNGKIVLTHAIQRLIISENITTFADLSEMAGIMDRLRYTTLHLINTINKEEIEAEIEIEGGA